MHVVPPYTRAVSSRAGRVRILVVATKSPWPPRDGGRLALWLTLQALRDAGHALTLVAPVSSDAEASPPAPLREVCEPMLVPCAPRGWAAAAMHAAFSGTATTVARHRHAAVERAVAQVIASWRPDVVHVEQLQALAHGLASARAARVPVVLRMQNVESALWQQVAAARRWWWPLRGEAARLRADERRAMASCAHTVALTEVDADVLRGVAAGTDAVVTALPPPFPPRWPCAASVAGIPALVLAGSAGWWPNRAATAWFLDAVAPALHAALPGATMHVFGGDVRARRDDRVGRTRLHHHAAPDDAADAFPEGAIALVPLHIGSGIRMRILEAWARGLPVIATSVAAAGLRVQSGRELLIADSAEAMVDAVRRLANEPARAAALVDAGRAYLARHHGASEIAARLEAIYLRARDERGTH